MAKTLKEFILVEPIAKTPYPPLGLMKIATQLKKKHKQCHIFAVVGNEIPSGVQRPSPIYITSLFTWDLKKVIQSVQFFSDRFPGAEVHVGGIAASLLPNYIKKHTGITPHIGLIDEAENCAPDYSLSFKRKIHASITLAGMSMVQRFRQVFPPRRSTEKLNEFRLVLVDLISLIWGPLDYFISFSIMPVSIL